MGGPRGPPRTVRAPGPPAIHRRQEHAGYYPTAQMVLSKSDIEHVGTPHDRLSSDGRWWWTHEAWAPPRYVWAHLTAVVPPLNRFMGALRVFPGAIVFAAANNRLGGAIDGAVNVEHPPVTIVHTDPDVAVIHGRFVPASVNTSLVLLDSETLHGGTAIVKFAGWQRRPLADVLRLAGFAVDVHDRTLSIGSDIGSAVELDRVRRASGGAN